MREVRSREETLARTLRSMPRLYRIDVHDDGDLGVPWSVLDILLSTPTLRVFEAPARRLLSKYERSLAAPHFCPAPISSFHYAPDFLRYHTRSSTSEVDVLALLVAHLSVSLQTIVVPSESTPFALMNYYEWPQLRELYIQGDPERAWMCRTPLVSVLSRMPRLRVLSLKFAHRTDQSPRAIWPPDHIMSALPWPDLESLTISWPSTEDRVFQNLPTTLRHLSLRSWPRLYNARVQPRTSPLYHLPWVRSAPSSTDLLAVLRLCPKGIALQRLHLEYYARGVMDDAELLRYVPTVFPHLRSLHIHRYSGAVGASAATVEEISAMMSRLQHLRVVRLYLDCKYRSYNRGVRGLRMTFGTHIDSEFLKAAAVTLLRDPGPSLDSLYLLHTASVWAVYHLVRDNDGNVQASQERRGTVLEDDDPYERIPDD
ncbi:hypothetical protein BV20DRAFT_730002 [Pilatotrama ljubarskyi]|nr:hypothetical protein BV20DRAFT_730002 [Pilatotrama ljubarskyi]